jgi:arylsulfatase A-like enzyme
MKINRMVIGTMTLPLLMGSCSEAQETQNNPKPNIIVVYNDDLGYGDLGAYGATKIPTPYTDMLAENGLLLTDAHATAATCTPSRYSLLTGSYAFRSGAAIQDGDAPMLIDENTPTLPGMLQQNGYKTAVIGKWHLGLGDGDVDWNEKITPGPLERGFDYSWLIPATGDRVPCVIVENHDVLGLDPHDPIEVSYSQKVGNDPTGTENPELLRYAADPQHSGTIVNGVSRIGWMEGGNAARWTDELIPHQMLKQAREFISDNKEDPFFLFFSYHDIHVPRLPDYRFQGTTELGPYGDVTVQMDWTTGQLVKYLEEQGLAENTLIIFSSDNGPVMNDGYEDSSAELLPAHGHQPAGPLRGGKYSAFEAGSRVPTIVYWPGTIQPGVSDALISQVDLYASVAGLLGHTLSENEAPDSKNLMDAWLGKSETGRTYLMKESFVKTLRKEQYKYIRPVNNVDVAAWIEGTKNIESGAATSPQLFDLSSDIAEQENIAEQFPELVEEMETEIQRIENNRSSR